MGCGCGKSSAVMAESKGKKEMGTPQFTPRWVPGAPAAQSSSYDDPMACYRCYVKHLAKAAVQADEYMEDRSRSHELAQCIGNVACAEDHAAALNLPTDREALRRLREGLWSGDVTISKTLLDMSVRAISALRDVERREDERRKREFEELERRRKESLEKAKAEKAEKVDKPDRPAEDSNG